MLIDSVNLTSLPLLNSAWSVVLYKGHGKPKNSHRSYRCLSSCPFVIKCLDMWILKTREEKWASEKADTQFLTKGSSHDLACILLTDCIRYATKTLKQPLYCLFLDKMSAFDKILKEQIILADVCALGGPPFADHASIYLANRLANRHLLSFSTSQLLWVQSTTKLAVNRVVSSAAKSSSSLGITS